MWLTTVLVNKQIKQNKIKKLKIGLSLQGKYETEKSEEKRVQQIAWVYLYLGTQFAKSVLAISRLL